MRTMTDTDTRARVDIPGLRGVCGECGQPVVYGTTVATERGPGGRAMILEPRTVPSSRFAVSWPYIGRGPNRVRRVLVRPLAADDDRDREVERFAMPHQAVCAPQLLPAAAVDAPLAEVLNLPRSRGPRKGWVRP